MFPDLIAISLPFVSKVPGVSTSALMASAALGAAAGVVACELARPVCRFGLRLIAAAKKVLDAEAKK